MVRAWRERLGALRRRSPQLDHVLRARRRYVEVRGSRMAAAAAYYGFFALFALAMLLFAALGLLLGENEAVTAAAEGYLRHNLPRLTVAMLLETSQNVSWVAIAGLVIAGLGWVTSLRASQRAIWGLEERPGHPVIQRLIDLVVLVGLGVALIVSVGVSTGLQSVLAGLARPADHSFVAAMLRASGAPFAVVVDLILAAALLAWVPRLRLSPRRLFPAALFVTVGLWLLKTAGKWYVGKAQHNPAYQVVAGAVGLLVFMYLFHQLVLYAAALAATSRHGTVSDLASARANPPTAGPGQPTDREPGTKRSGD